jgi:hypothetical protein
MKACLSKLAVFLVLIGLLYTGLFLSLGDVPFTDSPNHLARAVIMKSLWFDAASPYRATFFAKRIVMPYMLPDLEFVLLLRMFGARLAYPAWATLTMLVLAAAIWFYSWQLLASGWARLAAMACSWYFATNYLFILGFFSFQWGLAFAFFALGALHAWRGKKGRGWIAVYVAAVFATYGAHAACFAILLVLVAATGFLRAVLREQSWPGFAWELVPFAVLAGYHFWLLPAHPEASVGSMAHSMLPDKIARYFGSIFIRHSYAVDLVLLVLFFGIIAYALRGSKIDVRKSWELLTICGLASAGYFLLPIGLEAGWYVDERVLPFVFVPLVMLALGSLERSQPSSRQIRRVVAACCLLAMANLASLASFLPRENRLVAAYREALQSIPAGQNVLPVDTLRFDARTRPLHHAGSLYLEGYTPYLFSQKSGGGPSGYFEDRSQIYRPAQNWYVSNATPDWEKIAQSYHYVIVTKPWNPARLDLNRLTPQYENSVASVFRVK